MVIYVDPSNARVLTVLRSANGARIESFEARGYKPHSGRGLVAARFYTGVCNDPEGEALRHIESLYDGYWFDNGERV